jgi:phosphate starvation-inducible protein PhoH and related proteins
MPKKTKPQKPKVTPSGIKLENLKLIEPLTKAQQETFKSFKRGNHIMLNGAAGTGKTFIAMYLAFQEILSGESKANRIIIVRSAVPTRDMGFLPGDRAEKESTYLAPYIGICTELFGTHQAWNNLIFEKKIEFLTTSFVRGITLRNSIVIIEEMQNLTFHELDSIITRLGDNCRIMLCGDYYQTDLERNKDKSGILDFISVVESMKYFDIIEFNWQDIVRSGLVRDYIMTKEMIQKLKK